MYAVNFNFAFQEQTLHPERRARHKTGGIIDYELGDIFRMKSVHIFPRIKRAHDRWFVDLLGRRRLHQNAVNA